MAVLESDRTPGRRAGNPDPADSEEPLIIFDPVTHAAHFIDVAGEPPRERQELSIDFQQANVTVGQLGHASGPLRLLLDNRTQGRVLPGVFVAGPALGELLGGRRPFLSAKRLLTNQTFRDLYRTDTLDVEQRLKSRASPSFSRI